MTGDTIVHEGSDVTAHMVTVHSVRLAVPASRSLLDTGCSHLFQLSLVSTPHYSPDDSTMIILSDEGFNEYDAANIRNAHDLLLSKKSIREREGTVLNSLLL